MEIIMRKTSELTPYPQNAKKHDEKQIENVANSIRRFGWQQPIVIDEDGVVIIGHCRLLAAKKLGLAEVPVTVASGLTEDEIRELRIADNKTNESAWDFDLLAEDLAGLTFDGFDFDFDIEAQTEKQEVSEDECDKPIPNEPKSKPGDIYILGRHRLMCGDSTDIENVKKLLFGGVEADMLLTDPPYGVSYVGKTKDAMTIENDDRTEDELLSFLSSAFMAADSVMRPGAVFYIWHADSKGYAFRTACRSCGWEIRQVLIWEKNSLVLGRQDYQWIHEPCLYGWKEGAPHLWESDRKQTTILHFDRPTKSKQHPTMKPVLLFDYLMQNNTKNGDVVLDLFGGSGTTIIAAEQNGRRACVMEYDPRYVDAAIDRWETLTGEKAVLWGCAEK